MNGGTQPIEHIVVLMFENRSFDHLFGAFPGANGLLDENGCVKPGICNLADPTQPAGPSNQMYLPVEITPDVPLQHDFDHNFGNGMMQELFGPGTTGWKAHAPINAPVTYPWRNSGFVSTIAYNVHPPVISGPQAMSYYQYGSLKVLHALASEFVLCDNWFCDMPGDTLLNRFFMHTAQTDGHLSDKYTRIEVATIYDQIDVQGVSWKMYAPWALKIGGKITPIQETIINQQVDTRFLKRHLRESPFTHRPITEFASDLAGGTLPFYSFLMCWLPRSVSSISTDTSMHPNSDIRPGENYLAAVYNALRNSNYWNNTLLIVTFDENGGLYDHVPPPTTKAPNDKVGHEWDKYLHAHCTFDFTLLGPRVPALLISPWLHNGIARQRFQNTSILRYIQNMMGVPGLTQRDENAPDLASIFTEYGLPKPRPYCPFSIPGYAGFPYADGDLSKTYVVPSDAEIVPPPYMAELARIYGLD